MAPCAIIGAMCQLADLKWGALISIDFEFSWQMYLDSKTKDNF